MYLHKFHFILSFNRIRCVCSRKIILLLRSKCDFFLIGFEEPQILGSKLPTNRQVIKTLIYNIYTVKLSRLESIKLVVQEVSVFWAKARIETRQEYHCVEKLRKLYDEWMHLKRNAKRNSETEKSKRKKFTDKLDFLFDIAHETALEKLKDDDKQFLLNQRSKTREGCLMGVNAKLTKKEQRRIERQEKENARKRRHIEQQEKEKNGNYCKHIVLVYREVLINVYCLSYRIKFALLIYHRCR